MEPIPEERGEAGVRRDTPRTTCGAVGEGAGFQTSGQGRPSNSLCTPRRLTLCGYGLSLKKVDAERKQRFHERQCRSSGFRRLHQAKHEAHLHVFPGACSQDQKMLSWQPSTDGREAREAALPEPCRRASHVESPQGLPHREMI